MLWFYGLYKNEIITVLIFLRVKLFFSFVWNTIIIVFRILFRIVVLSTFVFLVILTHAVAIIKYNTRNNNNAEESRAENRWWEPRQLPIDQQTD